MNHTSAVDAFLHGATYMNKQGSSKENDVFPHKLKRAVLQALIMLHYFAELRHALATSIQCKPLLNAEVQLIISSITHTGSL